MSGESTTGCARLVRGQSGLPCPGLSSVGDWGEQGDQVPARAGAGSVTWLMRSSFGTEDNVGNNSPRARWELPGYPPGPKTQTPGGYESWRSVKSLCQLVLI